MGVIASAGPGSAWGTDELHGYRESEFYTRSTDDRGHSQLSPRIRLRPEIAQELSALVARRTIPAYRTTADFIRDAIVHRLHQIAKLESDPTFREHLHDSVQRIAMEEIAASYEAELDLCADLFRRVQATVEKAVRAQDYAALRTFVEQLRVRADDMRDPFRSDLLDLLGRTERDIPAGR